MRKLENPVLDEIKIYLSGKSAVPLVYIVPGRTGEASKGFTFTSAGHLHLYPYGTVGDIVGFYLGNIERYEIRQLEDEEVSDILKERG